MKFNITYSRRNYLCMLTADRVVHSCTETFSPVCLMIHFHLGRLLAFLVRQPPLTKQGWRWRTVPGTPVVGVEENEHFKICFNNGHKHVRIAYYIINNFNFHRSYRRLCIYEYYWDQGKYDIIYVYQYTRPTTIRYRIGYTDGYTCIRYLYIVIRKSRLKVEFDFHSRNKTHAVICLFRFSRRNVYTLYVHWSSTKWIINYKQTIMRTYILHRCSVLNT